MFKNMFPQLYSNRQLVLCKNKVGYIISTKHANKETNLNNIINVTMYTIGYE